MYFAIRDRLPMSMSATSIAAAAVAAAALFAAILPVASDVGATGAHLGIDEQGRLVVDRVDDLSRARQDGLEPGALVVSVNDWEVIILPQEVYDPPSYDPTTGDEVVRPPRIEPSRPIFVAFSTDELLAIASEPVMQLQAIAPSHLDQGSVRDGWSSLQVSGEGRFRVFEALWGTAVGALILVLIGLWLVSGRAGDSLRQLAFPLATATATPLLVQPLLATFSPLLTAIAGVLIAAAVVVLAVALVDCIADPRRRRLVLVLTLGTAAIAMLVTVFSPVWDIQDELVPFALIGAIPLIPGLVAARPIRTSASSGTGASSGRLLESTEFVVVGATPLFALATDQPPYLFPLTLWFLLVLAAGRFTIRPLARLASRATLQRDLIVAATEAERARVAADIHDDALQELTLLVHRLDAAGDAEGAEIARTVSDRLRAICGDLRLPILDDLGVGPALDWLVLRIERLAGGEVRLERSDGTRPPADVELAFFRVAQEALSNAVKHGRPPIMVRYSSTAGGASLTIDDAGAGIEPDAGETADHAGHFGLLNMQQRAEAIGAILDVRRWPAGGTHVKLDWRAR
ncbi:MAG: sensor histidine kinase [Candidatus Limnocylindrales bacterium]